MPSQRESIKLISLAEMMDQFQQEKQRRENISRSKTAFLITKPGSFGAQEKETQAKEEDINQNLKSPLNTHLLLERRTISQFTINANEKLEQHKNIIENIEKA